MNYTIIFSGSTKLNAENFVCDWNSDPSCSKQAVAKIEKSSPAQFDLSAGMVVLSSIATGMASSAIYDLIKHFFQKHEKSVHIKIIPSSESGGDPVIIIGDN
ncbi:hypothetical protein GMMP15_790030 [Candidatus Magnetomoraceae bacterium gMMP-15]